MPIKKSFIIKKSLHIDRIGLVYINNIIFNFLNILGTFLGTLFITCSEKIYSMF